jgi:hypothetical protein
VGTSVRGEDIRRGSIWWMYFVFMCETRIMKPVEIVLRSRERG